MSIAQQKEQMAGADRFLKLVETYTDIQELTPEIAREFIDRTEVHERSEPGKQKNYTQSPETLDIAGFPICLYLYYTRHTNASLLIAEGIDIVTLSGRLGHADKNVTLNTYSHIIKSKEKQAANKMEDIYSRVVDDTGNALLK